MHISEQHIFLQECDETKLQVVKSGTLQCAGHFRCVNQHKHKRFRIVSNGHMKLPSSSMKCSVAYLTTPVVRVYI
jgi:hypothetical protein